MGSANSFRAVGSGLAPCTGDWLLIADRNLYDWEDRKAAAASGAELLGWVKAALALAGAADPA